jgi:hypothetical protein
MCDKNLLGKKLEEGDYLLDLKKHRSFYCGELMDEKGVGEIIENGFSSINAVGNKSVGVILKKGIASPKHVKKIKGVPHLQVYCMKKVKASSCA